MINLFKSPAIMASGISKTIILSSDPDELCDRLKLLLQSSSIITPNYQWILFFTNINVRPKWKISSW